MTDRELLEKAAKAAGMDVVFRDVRGRGAGNVAWIVGHMRCWNPLTDDGDALRLGVALEKKHFFMSRSLWLVKLDLDEFDTDPNAAVRRAFVRAAAGTGKEAS